MAILKQIVLFYLKSNLHVAFAILSLFQISVLELNKKNFPNLAEFVFFGSIVGYSFLKYFYLKKRFFVSKFNYLIGLNTIICAVFGMYFYLNLNYQLQILFFGLLILVLIYSFLRKYVLLKISIVSFCISIVTVTSLGWDLFYAKYFLARFFLILALLIPFEIVDYKIDIKSIKTIPYYIGVLNTKWLGIMFLIISIFFNFQGDFISIFIFFCIGVFIFMAKMNQNYYFTNFWVESVPIIWYYMY